MRANAVKANAQATLMRGLQEAIASIDASRDTVAAAERQEAVRQFRRIERLFGYAKNTWSAFPKPQS